MNDDDRYLMEDSRPDHGTEDYYAAVEQHFVALRGSPLFVSPSEWQLIHRWWEAQIPLRVVKHGLDQAFANRKPHRPIRRLSYCRQTVEASYRRFREAVAGGKSGRGRAGPAVEGGSEVRDYLRRLDGQLAEVGEKLDASRTALRGAIDRTVGRLRELHEAAAEPFRLEELEGELEALETALLSVAESELRPEEREACRDAAERSLGDYRERMPEHVFQSARRSAYLKRVRSRFGLPALSLFYL